jgi:hypothetical protein
MNIYWLKPVRTLLLYIALVENSQTEGALTIGGPELPLLQLDHKNHLLGSLWQQPEIIG